MGGRQPDGTAAQGAAAVVRPHEDEEHRRVQAGDGAPHQLVERHALRRRRRQYRLLPLQLRAEAQPEAQLGGAGGWQRAGQRLAGCARGGRQPERRESAERLGLQHQRLAVHGRRQVQQEAERLPRLLRHGRREPARRPRHPCARRQEGLLDRRAHRRRLRHRAAGVRRADSAAAEGVGPGAGVESAQSEAGRADRRAQGVGSPLGRGFGAAVARHLLGRGTVVEEQRCCPQGRHQRVSADADEGHAAAAPGGPGHGGRQADGRLRQVADAVG